MGLELVPSLGSNLGNPIEYNQPDCPGGGGGVATIES